MIDITDVNRKFSMPVEFTRVDKGELLFLDNPKYQEMIARYPQLSGVAMNDLDTKRRLPVHRYLEPVNTRNWKQKVHRKSASLVSRLPNEQKSAESSCRQERSLYTYQTCC